MNDLDLEGLSPEGRFALQIAYRLALGFSRDELAKFYGQKRSWVSYQVVLLRREILKQLDAAPKTHTREGNLPFCLPHGL